MYRLTDVRPFEICVYICSDIAKNDAIKMKWIDDLNEGFVIKKSGVVLR
ncbi:MAG: hypothetical protein Ct9H300mP23_06730 [Nitrospinota bacterium]|nr:MAG: hypothetical protein Ct9H300mP23_06730 [Nitrospinota bacterium]